MRRRDLAALVAIPLLLLGLPSILPRPTGADDSPRARSVDGLVLPVADLDRARAFYTRVLHFEDDAAVPSPAVHDVGEAPTRTARLRLGLEAIHLAEYPQGRPVPADSRSHDRWFQHAAIVVSDMDQAYLWLRRHGVEHVSPAPQRLPDWNPQAAGIRAFYFRDPDRHGLELIEFPADKGAPRWRRPTDRVFLGIDHTAIVVADTEASVRFYRETLGMVVAGSGENSGPEQERLNAVPRARLRITTLRAPAGLAIELLEYLSPRDGRPAPADARTSDLVAWRTLVSIERSPRLLRDPDGHLLQLGPR